jgi:hypothetical protein
MSMLDDDTCLCDDFRFLIFISLSYVFTLIMLKRGGSPVSYQLARFGVIVSNLTRLVNAIFEGVTSGHHAIYHFLRK